MITFEHGHQSGRFDRSSLSLEQSAEMLIIGGAKLATFTEVGRESREQALRNVGKKFGYTVITGDKGGMDDCGIMYDEDFFNRLASGTELLSNVTYAAPGGGKVYAAWAVLEVGKKRLLVIVAHQASSVERGGHLRGAASRVRKWVADTKALKSMWNDLNAIYKCDAILVTCDWNVNIKLRAFRLGFKRRFPGMRIVPTKPYPARGTLGNRLIDFSLIRGDIKVKDMVVLISNRSSDHRPFRQQVMM